MKTAILSLFAIAAMTAGDAAGGRESAEAKSAAALLERIDDYRRETWRWQALMGRKRTPTANRARRVASVAYRQWVLQLWRGRAAKARRQAAHPPHKSEWLCIHRYEGPWKANTGNGYYGGLQMDLQFQRTYGPGLLRRKGTANRWTPIEQMWVAERAFRAGRGFYPWPVAARRCGLI